jgi:hypothetical protein
METVWLGAYDELVERARICARQARLNTSEEDVAAELWRMAQNYRSRAAGLNSDVFPEIGE